jgi:hypothetical protein
MKKKMKAFTLMELTIGMIIGSLIVAACYSGYQIIAKQYRDYKKNKDLVQEAIIFQFSLNTDFKEFQKVFLLENNLFFSNDSAQINYIIEPDYVLRKEKETLDTFLFPITEIAAVYVEDNNNSTYLKELSFQLKNLDEETTFHFQKEYSAETLMKNDQTEMLWKSN